NTLTVDTASGTGTGSAQQLTIYGRVPPVTGQPPAGTYHDLVTVTITFSRGCRPPVGTHRTWKGWMPTVGRHTDQIGLASRNARISGTSTSCLSSST
ncbi:spore coat protein U domain-containing protein, partial [[Pseudomonas] hibiscicola]